MGMRNGPEPENTTANPGFVNGMGTKDEPFVLKTLHIKNFGDGIESKETITITNLDPDTMISITDMASHTNRGRFNMDPIHVEGNVSDKGNGSVVFRLNFDDNVTEDDISGVYQGQIRVGSSSVYILWDVKVGDPEADELAIADKKAKESKAQEETEMKAIKEAEAKDKADKKATDKKIKEAEEKAAAAEAKAAAAEDKAASEKKARENAEDSARVVAEQAAKERLEQMDKEMEVRRAKLDEMDEETRKREEELLRISEKAKTIDFATLGVATSDQKDDLQRIKGVGPFIEDKLNALGIYTFEQVGNMTSKIEEQVNVAIEFFSGRIKRDKWANQAKQFSKKK
jgi:predicted flap endonuclease-1-like 5' DNA nuclease